MTENDFAIETAAQVWPEDAITTVLIFMDVGSVIMMNALIQMSLSLTANSSFRMNGRIKPFETIVIQTKILFSKFRVSNGLNDRLWRRKVRCVVAIIIFKTEESERET